VAKKLETFILVLLLTVNTANAKREIVASAWSYFYYGAMADLEKKQFEEAKRKLISAVQSYGEETNRPREELDTAFAKAVVDFYLKDVKSCETDLAQVAFLEPGITRSQPGQFVSTPLELLGDLRRAEGKDQMAKEQYRIALEAKKIQNAIELRKYRKLLHPLHEQRLLNKLLDDHSEPDLPPSDYIREYGDDLTLSIHPPLFDPPIED
jgi:hypothetical protein